MDDQEPEDAPLNGHRLLVCRELEFDLEHPDDGYTLRRVIVHLRPPDNLFDFIEPRLWLFAQVSGEEREYTVQVRMVRIGRNDIGEETAEDPVTFRPSGFYLSGDLYVATIGVPVSHIPFRAAGVHEFQLWQPNAEFPLLTDRIQVRM